MDYAKEYRRLLRMLVKKGMRIKLLFMNDGDVSKYPEKPSALPTGTLGFVEFIDDANQIHVLWDNGSTLAVIPELDEFEIIESPVE